MFGNVYTLLIGKISLNIWDILTLKKLLLYAE